MKKLKLGRTLTLTVALIMLVLIATVSASDIPVPEASGSGGFWPVLDTILLGGVATLLAWALVSINGFRKSSAEMHEEIIKFRTVLVGLEGTNDCGMNGDVQEVRQANRNLE